MTLILRADCQIISSSVGCVKLRCIDLQGQKAVKTMLLEENKHVNNSHRYRKITEDSLNHTRAETCPVI